jgi:phosphate transport system protein
MVHTPHLDIAYERELQTVARHVARMADHADQMVHDAILALLSRNAELAKNVRAMDEELDAMEIACDQLCVRLLARRSPVGSDLRMITAVLKLVTDLERIGDLAVNLVKRADQSHGLGPLPPEVAALATGVVNELRLSLGALKSRDAVTARRLRAEDASTDALNRAAFDRLIALAHEEKDKFDCVLALTNVCRNLERIGDHSVNISEMVVYMVEGKVLRHCPDA